jgi:hypothetical protein
VSLLNDIFDRDVRVLNGLLTETVSYAEMFSDVTRAFSGQRPAEIEAEIAKARAKLKKNDRVTWWLRLWKIGFMDAQSKRFPEIVAPHVAEKLANEYARRAHCTPTEALSQGWMVYQDHTLLATLEQLFSLPIPSIQSHVFRFDDPERILANFRKFETRWQHDQKDSFEDPSSTAILKFANGLAWFNLGRAHCPLEAKAMGHSGNKPREMSGDTILSLREMYHEDGRTMMKPVLTFILDKNGMLGEMKGRFNQRPDPQYYNEIVALLRLPLVHGIKGGGTSPEHNFRLSDLESDVLDSLLAEKPELGGLWAMYKSFGVEDPRVQECLVELLESESIKPPVLELTSDAKEFIITEYSDLDHFAQAIKDHLLEEMLAIYSGRAHEIHPVENLTDEDIRNILVKLSPKEYAKVMMAMGVRAVPQYDSRFEAAMRLAGSRLRESHFYEEMVAAVNESAKLSHNDLQALQNRIQTYVDVGWAFKGRWQHAHVGRDWDAPVQLRVSAHDLIAMVTASDEHDEDYLGDVYDVREARDWDTLNDDETAERRRDANLSDAMEWKAQASSDEVVHEIMSRVREGFDPTHAAELFAKKIS